MKIKNVSAYGELDVPLLRTLVAAGEEIEVTDDQAAVLLAQPGNWQPVDDEAKTAADAAAADLAAINAAAAPDAPAELDPVATPPEAAITAPPFDPGAHTVVEVNDYLSKADDVEKARVLAAESSENGGQARVGILSGPQAPADPTSATDQPSDATSAAAGTTDPAATAANGS